MNRMSKLLAAGGMTAGILSLGYVGLLHAAEAGAGAKEAVAHIHGAGPIKDRITGTVTFTAVEGGVKVVADVEGLWPGKHGFHIHEKADLSAPDLTSAGGHFNPDKHHHGGPETTEHHAGDLGNLTADDKGHAHLEETFKGLTIGTGADGVIGHSVIIHEKEDDLKSDPAGNAGKRIAGGAIEAGKSEK